MTWASAALERRHASHIFSLLFLFLLHSMSAAGQKLDSFPPPRNPFPYDWIPWFNYPPPPSPYGWKPRWNPPPPANPSPKAKFSPGFVVLIIVVIGFLVYVVSSVIYSGNRRARRENQSLPTVNAAILLGGGAVRPHGGGAAGGLDPAVVESFPTFVYSEVKQHKIGKGALECAVCLSEFEDDDNLRLLPKCDHVFHPHCIDSWFAAHTTCPVCRTDFAAEAGADAAVVVVLTVNDEEERPAEERSEEVQLLQPPARQRERILRSQSAGQLVQLSDDRERYTLRLPQIIRGDVVVGKFKRSASCHAAGEGSARKGRVGEDMIRGRRSSFKRTWDRSVNMGRGKDAGTSGGAAAEAGQSLS